MDEIWKPLVGFDGYEVSSLGRFRSIDRTIVFKDGRIRKYPSKILKQTINPTRGYWQIGITINNKTTTLFVHSTVAKIFLKKHNDNFWALHKNGDKNNNSVSNLYYGTPSQNMFDKRKHKTDHNVNKIKCPRGHLLQEPNLIKSYKGRACLACNRAKGVLTKGRTLQEISDEKYKIILGDI